MAMNFLLDPTAEALSSSGTVLGHVHDQYVASAHNIVTFYCPGKGHKIISAVLSGPINLVVKSQWQSLFGNSQFGQIVSFLDNADQVVSGMSIRQPWFGRKLWAGTDPMHFDLPLQFQSYDNAREEVFLPVMGLLSLLYPRINADDAEGKWGLREYFIPGPSLNFKKSGMHKGDVVEIRLGSLLYYTGCYITSLSLKIENSFSHEGWPHNVQATVGFDAMDVAFVEKDGAFMERGFENQAVVVGGWLDLIEAWGERVKESGEKAITAIRSVFN
jgi:hypothetical protein